MIINRHKLIIFNIGELTMNEERTVFDGRAILNYFGKTRGDFKPTKPEFSSLMSWVMQYTKTPSIFAPSLAFTKRTASPTSPREKLLVLTPFSLMPVSTIVRGVIRTEDKADGGILILDQLPDKSNPAIAGFNADCPFITGIIEKDGKKVAIFMLHGGLDCLHKPGEIDKQTIIHRMIADYGLNPNDIKIFVTAGIQPCCYGRSDSRFEEVFKLWGEDLRGITTKGPRANQTSLNLNGLIKKALLHAGVPEENIEMDDHCTSCDGTVWSNIIEPSPRNCVLFRLA
jgi:hypothetical protein